ncbi:uncharacterized protein AMSG_05413 [Thecamonas trahens ATCC 50062]|uniref:EF-hand domain-containing protein n=1 Tax=Thecamonas trahens ATCC 50062 TaxID=461836 RepID=A0A0L0DAZ5_THETB|nr:hypothetical protein AMSG_05413 [Thecamonas trahens ATCC 50062]KNC49410.1 hypothetical protein AMSG_05413 [Thecamonas trahens ATCC 50062]|eukprot:XP_013757834.1 hypothetical protein AMSG_05413 [Thecamonas trahens ATCC 50062]
MGGSASVIAPEQVAELKEATGFSQKEIKRLHKRFKKLDRNDDGRINVDEFKRIPELQTNPLLERIVELFDVDEDAYLALPLCAYSGMPRSPGARPVTLEPPGLLCGVCRTDLITGGPQSTLEELERPPCSCSRWSSAYAVLLDTPPKYAALPTGILESLPRLTTLALAGLHLAEIPASIASCPNLIHLDVSRNALTTLPPEIITLTKLLVLRADANDLSELPAGLGTLTSLLELSLSDNRFARVPPQIRALTSLRKLNLAQNTIELPLLPDDDDALAAQVELDVAAALAAAADEAAASSGLDPPTEALFPPSLEVLDLSLNNISVVRLSTPWADALPALLKLNLSHNVGIETVAPLFPPPPQLSILLLAGTSIPWFPGQLACALPNLRALDLAKTPLTILPRAALALISLKELSFQDVMLHTSGEVSLDFSMIFLFQATAACPHPLLVSALLEFCVFARDQLHFNVVRAGVGPALVAILHTAAENDAATPQTVIARTLELVLSLVDKETSKVQLLHDGLAGALLAVLLASKPSSQLVSLVGITAARIAETSAPLTRHTLLSAKYGGPQLLRALESREATATWAHELNASLTTPVIEAGVLLVQPVKAMQISGSNGSRPYAPYVWLKVFEAAVSSKSDYTGGHNPSWKPPSSGFRFGIAVTVPHAATLQVRMYDYRLASRDIPLGIGFVELGPLLSGEPAEVWIKLVSGTAPPDLEQVRAAAAASTAASSTAAVGAGGESGEADERATSPVNTTTASLGAATPVSDRLPPAPSMHSLVDGVAHSSPPLYSSAAAAQVTPSKLKLIVQFVPLSRAALDALPTKDKPKPSAGAWKLHPVPKRAEIAALVEAETAAASAGADAAGAVPASPAQPLFGRFPSLGDALGGDVRMYDKIYLALDAANAVYYGDSADRFIHQDMLHAVQFSTRASSQRYALVDTVLAGERMLVVAFMGTYSPADVVADLDLGAAPLLHGRVHRGIFRRACSIPLLNLAALLRQRLRLRHRRVVLTGHSLGGGVAVLTFLRLATEAGLTKAELERVSVVTFGQPLVGDSALADWMRETGLAARVTAVVNAGDLVASITLASPQVAAEYLLASTAAQLKAKDASEALVDSMVSSLSARLAPAFVEFAPVGTYYVVAPDAVEALVDPRAIEDALALPSHLTRHHLDQHGLPQYFDTLFALRGGVDPAVSTSRAMRWVTFDAARGSGSPLSPGPVGTATQRDGAGAPAATPTAAAVDHSAGGFESLIDAEFVDVDIDGATKRKSGGASASKNSTASAVARDAMDAPFAPTIFKVRTKFDVFARVIEVQLVGSRLSGLTKVKFRGAGLEYPLLACSETHARFRIATVPEVPSANWAALTLRAISHFGEARARLALGAYVNSMFYAADLAAREPRPQLHNRVGDGRELPGISLAVSAEGVRRAVHALVAALEDRDVFEGLVRSYVFSDMFQEQLAEASDIEMLPSIVNVAAVTLPRPRVELDAERNVVRVGFGGINIKLEVGFARLKLSQYLEYAEVGAEIELVNLHGSFSLAVGAGADGRQASAAAYTVDLDDLEVKLGAELFGSDGQQLTFKEKWGYSASLFRLFTGSMRGLFLWILGGASLKSFLKSELENVLVDSSTARMQYGDSHALLVDYSLTAPPELLPDMGESEGQAAKFATAHAGRIVLEGFEADAAYDAVAAPLPFDGMLARVHTHDVIVCISPYMLNTALVSAYLAGWLGVRVLEHEVPPELRQLLAADLGEGVPFWLRITATAPPTIVLSRGLVKLVASSRLEVHVDESGAAVREADIPFAAAVDVSSLSVSASGLEGLDALNLVDAQGKGFAKALAAVSAEWASGLREVYAAKVVPAFSRTLASSGVGSLKVVQSLPRTEGRVYVDETCVCVTFEVPDFVLDEAQITELKTYLKAQTAAIDSGAAVDTGLNWLESHVLSFMRRPPVGE